MRKFVLVVILMSFAVLMLSSCGSNTSDPASKVVVSYLNALVNKDSVRLSALSCAKWESDALLELDSLQAVKTRLDGLTCKTSGSDGGITLVSCQGNILATYDGEDQALDLSVRTYQIKQQGGEYLVCGYK